MNEQFRNSPISCAGSSPVMYLAKNSFPEFVLTGIPVRVISEADDVFSQTKPDICLVQTGRSIAGVMPHLELCAKHGVNVLTIAETLYYPW